MSAAPTVARGPHKPGAFRNGVSSLSGTTSVAVRKRRRSTPIKKSAPAAAADICYGKVMRPPAMISSDRNFVLRVREALGASWDRQTAYGAVVEAGNLALGQCYPTSRAVQHHYPATEIIKGEVRRGESEEIHSGMPCVLAKGGITLTSAGSNFPQVQSPGNSSCPIAKSWATAKPRSNVALCC
jgi:hypothetical protein